MVAKPWRQTAAPRRLSRRDSLSVAWASALRGASGSQLLDLLSSGSGGEAYRGQLRRLRPPLARVRRRVRSQGGAAELELAATDARSVVSFAGARSMISRVRVSEVNSIVLGRVRQLAAIGADKR